ncbi:enteropeptidase-like [Ixodes scapularis]|uniref:enteropeptidase-like n=1 Tax=Ixodes scapularis TaxID=6945 RepID=UPI001A9E0767|nr:enteropeptidase-like [Ixodes scapularis]
MSSQQLSFMLIVSTFFAGVCSRYTNEEKDDLMKICGRRGVQDTVSERIINGTEATPGHWSWMVGLYNAEDQFTCGGVLISNQFVLTAAHCYRNKNTTGYLSVRLGSTKKSNSTVHCQRNSGKNVHLERSDTTVIHDDLEDQVICMEVDYVCVPFQDNCTLFMKDLALLKLKEPVNFTRYIRPICLPEYCEEPPANASIYVVGWGTVYEYDFFSVETDESLNEPNEDLKGSVDSESSAEETNDTSSSEQVGFLGFFHPETLMERNISLITNEQCERQLATTVPNCILCSKGGTCSGDSGGPLMYEKGGQWFLAAIHSVGGSCYHPSLPSLHVRVSHLVDRFILPVMQDSQSTKHNFCIEDEARKECVTAFYNSYNISIDDSAVDDETT